MIVLEKSLAAVLGKESSQGEHGLNVDSNMN